MRSQVERTYRHQLAATVRTPPPTPATMAAMAKIQMTHDLHQVTALFATATHPWAIGGGWAVDLHLGLLGRRPHADVDVVSFRSEADGVRETLAGWDLRRIVDGEFDRWLGPLEPAHQVWARPTPTSDWAFEVLFEDVSEELWRYRRNPAVTLPEAELIAKVCSIPTLHLGVALLYKAPRDDAVDLEDLKASLGLLRGSDAEWLRNAVAASHGADHRWIPLLTGASPPFQG